MDYSLTNIMENELLWKVHYINLGRSRNDVEKVHINVQLCDWRTKGDNQSTKQSEQHMRMQPSKVLKLTTPAWEDGTRLGNSLT